MTDLTLTIDLAIDVPGATPEEIQRGIAAAWQVLQDAGVTAWQAANAAFHQEAIDDGGGAWKEFTDLDAIAAKAWREADYQAAVACCAGWQDVPTTAHLELVYDRDAYAAWAREGRLRRAKDAGLLRVVSRSE